MKPTQNNYDYSKFLESAKQESQYTSFSTFIDEKIHKYREEYFDGEAHSFNRYTLANTIGINSSTLTKIINGSQVTRKRDLIIALCFALHLTEDETNLALNLYPMAPLNPNNLRDLVIIQALYDGLSVKQLDETLIKHKYSQLNILRKDSKNEERELYIPFNSTIYEEISINITPYCIAGDDLEVSLHERYLPTQYSYHSKMIVQKQGINGTQYRISLNGDDYDIEIQTDEGWKLMYSDSFINQKYCGVISCDDADLLNEILKLKEYTDSKARYIRNMCNDTKNYISRFDARNDCGRLVVYGERFGFGAPEFSEYFQLKITSEECEFSISNSSKFMEKYLGLEKWTELYGQSPPPVIQRFKSLGEITCQRWQSNFKSLLLSASELVSQLQTRKLFLFNARAWLEIDELMHTFQVEEAFKCYQPDDLPYEIVPGVKQIVGLDGKIITIEDLYRAAELDIFTVKELCDVRARYGSLEGFLMLEVLEKQKGKYNEQ